MMTSGKLLRALLTPMPKPLLWMFARRFIAGKNMTAALSTASALNTEGFRVSLNYIGEGCADNAEVSRVKLEYLLLNIGMGQRGIRGDISLKLSQLGLLQEEGGPDFTSIGKDAFAFILSCAVSAGIRVWVDAEELRHRTRTWEIIEQYPLLYPHLGICVQAHAEDAVSFLRDHLWQYKKNAPKPAIRVCKGAYREPEHHLLTGDALNENFLLLCMTATASDCQLQVATHDERLIRGIKGFPFEYGMLLGVNPKLARAFLNEGKRVNIYTAYGPDFKPYLIRRIAEHPSYIFLPFRNA